MSPCGTTHKKDALPKKKKNQICLVSNFYINLESQVNGVDKKLHSFCSDIDHEFFLPTWDLDS